jgi:hypothetical protein
VESGPAASPAALLGQTAETASSALLYHVGVGVSIKAKTYAPARGRHSETRCSPGAVAQALDYT